MGKPTGFMEYDRQNNQAHKPKERIKNYNEFHIPLSKEERRRQGARCMDCGVPFCQSGMTLGGMTSGCPLNNLIPEWNDLVYTDNLEQALWRLMKTNNFPEFTSRVCPAPCEAACTCGLNEKPVTIKENEYAVIENGYEAGLLIPTPPKVRTGKKAAVIGSGPAGLTAADQLNKRGHEVTVFERSDRPGGLLMYGIPNMKLEKEVILRRISHMEKEGIKFVLNTDIKTKEDADKLMKEYDTVILACGASSPRDIKAPGREGEGIHFAVDYLKSVTKSLLDSNLKDGQYINARDKDVLIIGGGDTGNDCVATAMRQGAKSVIQLEMMPKAPDERTESNPWPEWPRVSKTDYGQEEARAVFGKDPRIYETTVKEFIRDKTGTLVKVKCVKVKRLLDKKTNRIVMKEAEGTEFEVKAGLVLIAAGFTGAQGYAAKAFGVELDEKNNIKTVEGSYKTSRENIFTAGDMHRGQSLVVWAIREGREAARKADRHLMGYTNLG